MMNRARRLSNGAIAMRLRIGSLALATLIGVAACDLDLTNPNAPTEGEVLPDTDGLISLAVAMQGQMANSIHQYIRAPALVTDEWSVTGRALAADRSLVTGDPDFGFLVVSDPYVTTYRVVRSANDLIESAPATIPGVGLRSGILALAHLYKGMALGWAIQHYEEVPIQVSTEGAPLRPRAEVLDTIVANLETARETFARPDLDLSGFNARVLGTGFRVLSTIDAMLARYHLMAGNYQQAIDAADRVPLDQLSVWSFPDPQLNPVYNYHFQLLYTGARQDFVDEAEAGDERPEFWVQTEVAGESPGFDHIPIRPIRQYSTRNAPFPVYLPGEMLLIKAEAYARLTNLAQAVVYINEVRTQCDSPVNEPTACLPAYLPTAPAQQDVLEQIAYERRYELFMQGLRWEDLRRFAGVVDETPSTAWLPLPRRECETNPYAADSPYCP